MLSLILSLVIGSTSPAVNTPTSPVEYVEINERFDPKSGQRIFDQIILYRWGYWPGGVYGYGVADFCLIHDDLFWTWPEGDKLRIVWYDKTNERLYEIRVSQNAVKRTQTHKDPEADNLKLLPSGGRETYFPYVPEKHRQVRYYDGVFAN